MSKPDLSTLMMLGHLAPKSPEEGKPEVPVRLTYVECQALRILAQDRFQALFDAEGEHAQNMAAIYLHVTSKLMIGAMGAGLASAPSQEVPHNDVGTE